MAEKLIPLFQFGFVAMSGVIAYFLKRLINKVEDIDTKLNSIKTDIAVYSIKIDHLEKELQAAIEHRKELDDRLRLLEMKHAS